MLLNIVKTLDVKLIASSGVSVSGWLISRAEMFMPLVQFTAGVIGILSGLIALALGVRSAIRAYKEDFGNKKSRP